MTPFLYNLIAYVAIYAGFLCLFFVISRRYAAEKSEEAEILSNIIVNARDGLITIDGTGIVQSFNPACEKIFGYTPSI